MKRFFIILFVFISSFSVKAQNTYAEALKDYFIATKYTPIEENEFMLNVFVEATKSLVKNSTYSESKKLVEEYFEKQYIADLAEIHAPHVKQYIDLEDIKTCTRLFRNSNFIPLRNKTEDVALKEFEDYVTILSDYYSGENDLPSDREVNNKIPASYIELFNEYYNEVAIINDYAIDLWVQIVALGSDSKNLSSIRNQIYANYKTIMLNNYYKFIPEKNMKEGADMFKRKELKNMLATSKIVHLNWEQNAIKDVMTYYVKFLQSKGLTLNNF